MKLFVYLKLIFFLNILTFCQRDIILEHQKSKNWCYAAATKMILDSYNINYSQEQIVNKLKKINEETIIKCDSSDKFNSNEFYKTLSYSAINDDWIPFFKSLGFTETKIIEMNRNQIIDQIKKGPMIGLFSLNSNFSHAIVISEVWRPRFFLFNKYLILKVFNPGVDKICDGGNESYIKWNPISNEIMDKDFKYSINTRENLKNNFSTIKIIAPIKLNQSNGNMANLRISTLNSWDELKKQTYNFSIISFLSELKAKNAQKKIN